MGESANLPEGLVTFLFSDVEASTVRASELGDHAWADVLEAHRALLRAAFSAHGGVEVQTEGDAFFVAFERPDDAVAAAVEGQVALEAHGWPPKARVRVRIGIHSGQALVREESYVGHAVHKAKRVCDAGHGGQVLVSATTAELLSASELRDLGLHRLKDLGEPQRIFQVQALGLARDFPPLRSLGSYRHNLPTQRTPLVGRAEEIEQVRKLLGEARLVSLTGVGGCGKTRLAVHVGADVLEQYEDGVFFVDLAPVSSANEVPGAFTTAIGLPAVRDVGVTDAERQLVEFLSARTCLLIVDNCEHVLDESAEVVDRILDGCPRVAVLATSREPLALPDERSIRVPSLSRPDGDDLYASDAVRLFAMRAEAVAPEFELSDANVGAVAEICRRLDGIPLAIELAAARMSHLSAQQISNRLDDMFRLLTGGRRRVQRQQTLAAALDWSYELLEEPSRALLRSLSVFPGSFSLDAVEAVCGADQETGSTLDTLGALVNKSLVVAVGHRSEVRYRLLETVRLYAEEKLNIAREADAGRDRHANHFLDWLRAMGAARAMFDPAAHADFELEMPNIRAALRWLLGADRYADVGVIVARVGPYWGNSGSTQELQEWTTLVIEHEAEVDPSDLVDSLSLRAFAKMTRQPAEAIDDAGRAVEIAGDHLWLGVGFALMVLSFNMTVVATAMASEEMAQEARLLSDRALSLARAVGSVETGRFAANYRSMSELILGDLEAALDFCEHGAGGTSPTDLSRGAVIAHLLGDDDGALRWAEDAMQMLDRRHDQAWWFVHSGQAHIGVAVALAGAGRADEAWRYAIEQLQVAEAAGDNLYLNDALITSGAVAFLFGDRENSCRWLAAARACGVAAGDGGSGFGSPMGYALYRHYVGRLRAELGVDRARELRDEGAATPLPDVIATIRKSRTHGTL